MVKKFGVVFIALIFLFSCQSEGVKKDEKVVKKTPKGDCPDCDPAGPNAFIQAGLGNDFYKPGESWKVVFEFEQNTSIEMIDPYANVKGDNIEVNKKVYNGMFTFQYKVLDVRKVVVNNVQREVAKIEITQVWPDPVSDQKITQFDKKLEFEIDDLLNPVSETVYNTEYPHGKEVELDSTASLKTGSSIFPHNIPRVLTGGIDSPAPEMPQEFVELADQYMPDWRNFEYKKYVFKDFNDVVYFAKGFKWPFYMETSFGKGLLISFEGK